MALITVPDFLADSMDAAQFGLTRQDVQLRSAFTGQRQVLDFPAFTMWRATFTVPLLYGAEAGRMRSFLTKMRGRVNTCNMPVPGYDSPTTGYAGAAGLVNGGGQTGYALETDGWTAGAAIFAEGDYFTVNGELKMVTADVTANGSGQATITFEPALRVSPANNAPLTIVSPYAVMCLVDPNAALAAISAPYFHAFSVVLEEALNVA